MIELNPQEKDWFKCSSKQPVYGEGILTPDQQYKIVMINDKISFPLSQVTNILGLDQWLGSFCTYLFHLENINTSINEVDNIWKLPALYIGETGGGADKDIKSFNGNGPNAPYKTTAAARIMKWNGTLLLDSDGNNTGKKKKICHERYQYLIDVREIYFSMLVPADMKFYSNCKKHWVAMMEKIIQCNYQMYHGEDPPMSGEYKKRSDHEGNNSQRHLATTDDRGHLMKFFGDD